MAKLKDGTRVYGTLTVDSALTANADVTINGNLVINGTTTTTNSTVTRVEDPVLEQGGGANGAALTTNDNMDRGTVLHYYANGAPIDAFMGWKNVDGQFEFGSNVSVANNIVTINDFANVKAAHYYGEGDTLGNITGANVTGTVAYANNSSYAGLVTGATQANITSLGTLTGLTIGNATANTTFGNGTINASGLVNVYGNFLANANAVVGGNLTVNGNIYGNFSGNLVSPGSNGQVLYNDGNAIHAATGISFDKTTNVTTLSAVVVSNDANVTGTVTGGNLTTTGTANVGTLAVTGDETIAGTSTITGNLSAGNISTAGTVTATGTVTGGNLSTSGDLSVSGNSSVIGNSTVTGNITGSANLTITNAANIGGNLSVTGNVTLGNLSSTGTANLGALIVTGNSNISGAATFGNTVTGITGGTGDATAYSTQSLKVAGGGAGITGDSYISGKLGVSSTANVGNLATPGYANVTGNVSGGNLTTAGTANVGNLTIPTGGVVTGDLIPAADQFYNLGNATAAWKDLWLSGSTIKLGTQTISSNTTTVSVSSDLAANNIYIANNANVGNLYSAGIANITSDINGGANLSITGWANITGNVIGGNLTTTGTANVGTLAVTGNETVAGTSTITGNLAAGNISTAGIANVTGTATVGNLSTAGTASITGNTSTGNLTTTGTANISGNLTSANANLGNLAKANYFSGKFDSLSSNQSNITTIGTLNGLTVSGNTSTTGILTDNYYYANGVPVDFNQAYGSNNWIQFKEGSDLSASANLTFDPTTSVLGVIGNISTTNANLGNLATANYVAGTLTTATQPNITSVGTLSSLVVSGNVQSNATVLANTVQAVSGDVTISGQGTNANVILVATGTGTVDVGGAKITSVGTPVNGTDAATKGYVDGVASGLNVKDSVRTSADANITLSGLQTLDGVVLADGDRVLVRGQTNGKDNGIYDAHSGAWTRSFDANTSAAVTAGTFAFVELGDRYAETGWVLVTQNPITLGTTPLTFSQFSAAGEYTAGDGVTMTGTVISAHIDNSTIDISSGALHVKDGLTLVTPNIGAATGQSLDLGTGNINAGNITVVTNVSASTLTGSLTTANQSNITQVGTLIELSVSGNTSTTGILTDNYYYANGAPVDFNTAYGSDNWIQFKEGADLSASANLTFDPAASNLGVNGNIVVGAGSGGNITGANLVQANYFSGMFDVLSNAQPNITSVGTLLSLSVTGNITGGNLTTTGTANVGTLAVTGNETVAGTSTITGNLAAGNISTAGTVTATGTVTGGNLSTGGTATVTGTATVGNLSTAGTVTATGNITGGNLTTTGTANVGTLAVTGNETVAGTSTITGNLAAGNISTAGTVTATGTVTGGNLSTGGTATVTGNLSAGNISTTGSASVGSLSSTTDITAIGNISGDNLSASENLSVMGYANITGTATVGNLSTAGIVSATGNVSGGNLTTIGVVSATGNVSGGNLTTIGVVSATGNVSGGNITTVGVVSATGNVSGGNLTTTGNANVAGTANVANLVVTGTASFANLSVSGQISASNLAANSLTTGAVVFAGTGGLLINSGNLTFSKTTNTLTTTNLTVNGLTSLGDIGNVSITGGTAGQWLRTDGTGNLTWQSIDAAEIYNGTSNVNIPVADGDVFIAVGGANIVDISGTGANVTGIITATGNIIGNNITANGLLNAVGNVDSTSSITGTLTVTGGIGATGNIYTGHSVGFANNNSGTASAAYIQFNATANSLDFIFN